MARIMTDAEKRRASILVVDDDETIVEALCETLRRQHYEVAGAPDAITALQLVREKQFTVILTDHQMPQITGLEFLQQVKTLQPDATRILITGVVNLNTVIDAINKGEIYRFIVKPWLREELLMTVQNAVQRFDMLQHTRELQEQTQTANLKLATQVAKIADQNQQLEKLNSALHRNLDQSVQLCLKTLDAYWPVLSNQAYRVQELCRAMA
ncbi:MAG TPA: response regulator, partial [Candidatus Acidoferrum sp.]|nr:response regulator [Candidatus Acidoferrum sp.]